MDRKCPHCGTNMPEEAVFCLKCCKPLNVRKNVVPKQQLNYGKPIITAVCVTVLATVLFVTMSGIASQNDNKKTTVIQNTTAEETVAASSEVKTEKEDKETSSKPDATTTETTTEETTNETTESTTKESTTESTTASKSVIIYDDKLIQYPDAKKSSAYTVPYKVKSIADDAFNNNKHLKTLKFSKREKLRCNWAKLYSSLPNLETVYVYPGTDADLIGLQYFNGEIVYYD